MSAFLDLLDGVLDAAMMLLALAIVVALIAVVVLYVIDVTQNSQMPMVDPWPKLLRLLIWTGSPGRVCSSTTAW